MNTYDIKINNQFYIWLIFCLSLVFLIIVVGGLTRLTNSGLSITEWEIFAGILPPFTPTTTHAHQEMLTPFIEFCFEDCVYKIQYMCDTM